VRARACRNSAPPSTTAPAASHQHASSGCHCVRTGSLSRSSSPASLPRAARSRTASPGGSVCRGATWASALASLSISWRFRRARLRVPASTVPDRRGKCRQAGLAARCKRPCPWSSPSSGGGSAPPYESERRAVGPARRPGARRRASSPVASSPAGGRGGRRGLRAGRGRVERGVGGRQPPKALQLGGEVHVDDSLQLRLRAAGPAWALGRSKPCRVSKPCRLGWRSADACRGGRGAPLPAGPSQRRPRRALPAGRLSQGRGRATPHLLLTSSRPRRRLLLRALDGCAQGAQNPARVSQARAPPRLPARAGPASSQQRCRLPLRVLNKPYLG